jgi:hypothetical protein
MLFFKQFLAITIVPKLHTLPRIRNIVNCRKYTNPKTLHVYFPCTTFMILLFYIHIYIKTPKSNIVIFDW